MSAPTFVAEYEVSSWSATTTPKTVTVDTNSGDRIIVLSVGESEDRDLGPPSGNSITFTQQQLIDDPSPYCWTSVWTGTDSVGGTGWTLSQSRTGNPGEWGFTVLRFSGSDGFGASAKATVSSGAPSLNITTTQDNSAICVVSGDWNAVDGSTRTWRTANVTPTAGNGLERVYFRDAAAYTVYVAYYSDVGATGTKTVGLSAPSGQKYGIIAVEVKGTSAGAPVFIPRVHSYYGGSF